MTCHATTQRLLERGITLILLTRGAFAGTHYGQLKIGMVREK